MEGDQCQLGCRWCQWFSQTVELVMFCKLPFHCDFCLFGDKNSNWIWNPAVSSLEYRCRQFDLGEMTGAMALEGRKDEEELVAAVMKPAAAGGTDRIRRQVKRSFR